MIVITVLSFNGAPSDGRSASFDELGGSIGRADTNQLVLPDPERSISRVHAQVVFRNGGYALVDRGSNAVLVNGQPVGNGREVPLRDGDQVQVGGYLLGVSMGQRSAAVKDPFADLFGDTYGVAKSHPMTEPGVRRRADAPAPAVPSTPAAPPSSSSAAFDLFAPSPPAAGNQPPAAPSPLPFAPAAPSSSPLFAPPSPAASSPLFAPSPAPSSAAPSSGGLHPIPADWDPFAPDTPSRATAAPAVLHDPHAGLLPDLPLDTPSQESSLDSLFGLGGGSAPADPLARSLPEAAKRNTAGAEDPLQALFNDKPPAAAPVADHASELNTPWTAAPLQDAAARPPQPKGAVFSWEQPSREGRVVTQPGARRADAPADEIPKTVPLSQPITQPFTRPIAQPVAPPAPAAPPADDDEPLTMVSPRPAPPRAPAAPVAPSTAGSAAAPAPSFAPSAQASSSATPARSAAPDALLAAFRDGLGLPDVPAALGEEEMRLLGRLLRESAQGTVQLLLSRAALKREMRAEVTVIAARENNPLKFSPSAEVALQYLLGGPKPGFLAPEQAMRDAYNDLRAHQLGMMAGMRSALDGVLQRFDPAVLEGQIARRSGLGALLGGNRRAQLWEQFQALYSQLSREASDDFHQLFGKAFLAAYEEYIEQLQSHPGDGR
jgi:type VI secretion system FHA domain protein